MPEKDLSNMAERGEQSPNLDRERVHSLVEEIKEQTRNDKASAFVHARTNFNVDGEEGDQKVEMAVGGYKNMFFRGNINGRRADDVRSAIQAVNRGYKEYEDPDEGTMGIPPQSKRETNTLYVSVIDFDHLDPDSNALEELHAAFLDTLDNMSAVEVRYKQPDADESHRTAEKMVYLVVPRKTAEDLSSLIRDGVDPNIIRDSLGDIFLDQEHRQLYDANILDYKGTGGIEIQAKKPNLDKVYLAETLPGGKKNNVLGKSNIYEHSNLKDEENEEVVEKTNEEPEIPETVPESQAEDKQDEESEVKHLPMEEPKTGQTEKPEEFVPLPFDVLHPSEGGPIPFEPLVVNGPVGSRPIDEYEATAEAVEEGTRKGLGKNRLDGAEGKEVEGQLKAVRELLDEIESNNFSLDHLKNADKVSQLEAKIDFLDPEVGSEVRARLHLQACLALATNLPTRTEDMALALRTGVTDLGSKGYLLEGEDFHRFFKEGLRGTEGKEKIDVNKAFMVLQNAAYHKIQLNDGSEVRYIDGGKGMTNSQYDELREKLIAKVGGDREQAAKALQLAHRIARATFETSVWNSGDIPPDPVADAIYFRYSRHDSYKRGQDFGPSSTVDLIDGFGTSFFRQLTTGFGADKKRFLNENRWQTEVVKNINDRKTNDRIAKNAELKFWRITDESGKLLTDEEIERYQVDLSDKNLLAINSGAYGAYLSSYLPGMMNVKDLMLKTDWKPDDISPDAVQGWFSPFDKVDPADFIQLKVYLVMGMFDEGLKNADRLGWGQNEIFQAVRVLMKEQGRTDDGKPIVFINPKQMDFIINRLNVRFRAMGADFMNSLRGLTRVRK